MADEEPKKTTKTVPLTGTLEQSVRGYRDARKASRRRALATMAGRVPTEAQSMAAHAETVKAFAPVLKELGEIEGRLYDSEEARRKDKTTLAKSWVSNAIDLLETQMRTASADKRAALQDRHKYFSNVLKALEYMDGKTPRGQRVLGGTEAEKQFQTIMKYVAGTKNPNPNKVASMFASAFGNKEQRDEYIGLLGEQFNDLGLADLEAPADSFAETFAKAADNMGLGKTREVADLTDEVLTGLGIDPQYALAATGFGAGVQLAVDPRGHLASYLAGGPTHPTGYPDTQSDISGVMAELASALSGSRTGNLPTAVDDFVSEVNMTPQQLRELEGMSYYRQHLLQAMQFPDAPDGVRQAQVQLLSDPNYQAFKKSRGYETDKIAVRDLMKMLRKTDRGRKKRDRMRSKEFRKTGYRDQKTQKVFEALRSQEAETSKKGTDSADLTQGATSVEDVSDFTKGVASRNPLGIGTKR